MLRELRNTHVALRQYVELLEVAHLTCDLRRALILSAMIDDCNIKLEQLKKEGFRVCG